MHKEVIKGFLRERGFAYDDYSSLVVVDPQGDKYDRDYPLAQAMDDLLDAHGHYVSLRYMVADQPITDIDHAIALYFEGFGEAEHVSVYSDYTGYLWTDSAFKIGGHDMLRELEQHIDKWVWVEMEFHKEPHQ